MTLITCQCRPMKITIGLLKALLCQVNREVAKSRRVSRESDRRHMFPDLGRKKEIPCSTTAVQILMEVLSEK